MKAVNLIDRIDEWVNTHMSLILRAGGIFAFAFITVVVPSINSYRLEKRLHETEQRYDEYVENSNNALDNLQSQVNNLNKKYAKKMVFEREAKCLADNIYYEAGTSDREGMLAVAQVTINRVRNNFAPSVCGVVHQKIGKTCQFSWVCRTHNYAPEKSYYRAQEVANKSLTRGVADVTLHKALYYHADYVHPSWADSKEFVTQIGKHLFYAEAPRAAR